MNGMLAPSLMASMVARYLLSPSTSLYFSTPSSLNGMTVTGLSTPFAFICSLSSFKSKSLRTLKPSITTMLRGSIRNRSVRFVAFNSILKSFFVKILFHKQASKHCKPRCRLGVHCNIHPIFLPCPLLFPFLFSASVFSYRMPLE